jgi:transposase
LAQAIGRSRGGRTTKIHAVVDCLGRLIAFEITPGQLGDVRVAGSLLAPIPAARLCIADTAYDSNGLRQFLSERGTQPVIPNNPTRKRFQPFYADIYKRRNLIERMFYRLKDGAASPPATTSWPPTSQPPSPSPPSSCGGPD